MFVFLTLTSHKQSKILLCNFVWQFFIPILGDLSLRMCMYALVFIVFELENKLSKISKELPDL